MNHRERIRLTALVRKWTYEAGKHERGGKKAGNQMLMGYADGLRAASLALKTVIASLEIQPRPDVHP